MLDPLISQFKKCSDGDQAKDSGEFLFRRGDDVQLIYLLTQGQIKLSRTTINGADLILHKANAPAFIAEASLYSDHYHCDAEALEPICINYMHKNGFLKILENTPALHRIWTSKIAHDLQAARFRSEILTQKKISERLDAWLDLHQNKLPNKGSWKTLAAELGASPEALYRELSSRRTKR